MNEHYTLEWGMIPKKFQRNILKGTESRHENLEETLSPQNRYLIKAKTSFTHCDTIQSFPRTELTLLKPYS